MNADELEGLRHLRVLLGQAYLDASVPWVREQTSQCIAAIDALLALASPQPIEVQRLRARAKSVLAAARITR